MEVWILGHLVVMVNLPFKGRGMTWEGRLRSYLIPIPGGWRYGIMVTYLLTYPYD